MSKNLSPSQNFFKIYALDKALVKSILILRQLRIFFILFKLKRETDRETDALGRSRKAKSKSKAKKQSYSVRRNFFSIIDSCLVSLSFFHLPLSSLSHK